jgi:N-acetylglucosaminyldiphosphoundecaprenol N-acetyl-beta-D-mannosaminyltransferase
MTNIIKLALELHTAGLFVNTPDKQNFLNKVHKASLRSTYGVPAVFNYLYTGSLYFALSDSKYLAGLKSSYSVHIDGFFLRWVLRALLNKKVEDFTTSDFFDDLLNYCVNTKKRVFILGSYSCQKGIGGALAFLNEKYPSLKIEGMHGFSDSNSDIMKRIEEYKPEILVVGLGVGFQERWIYQNINLLKSISSIIAVGNYIDVIGGRSKEPLQVFKTLHIRWLMRLIKEPRRLWKRYLVGFFVVLVLTAASLYKKVMSKINL